MLLCLVSLINFVQYSKTDYFILQVISVFRAQQGHVGYYIKPVVTSHVLLAVRWYLTLSGWFVCPSQILFCHLCICLFESSKENAHCWFHSSALVCNKIQVCVNNVTEIFFFFWIGCFRKSYFLVCKVLILMALHRQTIIRQHSMSGILKKKKTDFFFPP